jgi:hypothetical protein
MDPMAEDTGVEGHRNEPQVGFWKLWFPKSRQPFRPWIRPVHRRALRRTFSRAPRRRPAQLETGRGY